MANYYAGDPTVMWIVVLAFIISFILAMGLGANDVANSFGTSVGAKVLTLYQACIIASIFETAGAILLGYRVSDTIRKGLFDPDLYNGREELLMIGNLCALSASGIWLFTATALSVPVSATHSVVGATLGFHMVVFGGEGVGWDVIILIVISWFTSPILSGIVSSAIYGIIHFSLLKPVDPMKWGLYSLPLWYFFVIFIYFFSIFYGSSVLFGFDEIWIVILIAFGSGLLIGGFAFFFIIPYTEKKVKILRIEAALEAAEEGEQDAEIHETVIDNGDQNVVLTGVYKEAANEVANEAANGAANGATNGAANGAANGLASDSALHDKNPDDPDVVLVPEPYNKDSPPDYAVEMPKEENADQMTEEDETSSGWLVKKGSKEWNSVKDSIEVRAICSPMQVLSAAFSSFSHGGNDVSNAIGPLVSLWIIFTTGSVSQDVITPIWLLVYGGVGISLGLFLLGRRVIKTVGEDLTPMTPSSGFCINLGSAATVLLASSLGIPVSTTHCQVGSVCCIGWLRTRKAVDWSLFSGIFLAWVVTLPATIMLSAALMGLLQHTVPGGCDLQPIPMNTSTIIASTLSAEL